MNKFLFVLSIFTVSAFLALTVGVSQALAGHPSSAPTPVSCSTACNGAELDCDGTNDFCLCEEDDCFGTPGDDVMCGDGSDQVFHGGRGDDIICAAGGNDTLHGGWGCDDLQGEADDDTLRGGHCADSHQGGSESDTCKGGWGDDTFDSCAATPGKTADHKSQGGCISTACGNVHL